MSDFTVVIPHRGSSLGLWATITSCEEDLVNTRFSYNYVVVSNGAPIDLDTKNVLHYLQQEGKLLKHLHYEEALSPPAARQRGSSEADGELVFFFDNHCLVSSKYFDRALAQCRERGIDFLHAATVFYAGQGTHYHYNLKLDYNFWAESTQIPYKELAPYRMAAGGHGAFVVRRSVWEAVGGYGPESLLQGYAGEETLCDLKMWRYGKEVWIDPKLVHYHHAGARGYSRHYTVEYYTNLLVSAFVIGGEKWLYRVFNSFLHGKHLRSGKDFKNWYSVLETAHARGAEYAKHVDSNSVMTLDELLVYFRTHQIAM